MSPDWKHSALSHQGHTQGHSHSSQLLIQGAKGPLWVQVAFVLSSLLNQGRAHRRCRGSCLWTRQQAPTWNHLAMGFLSFTPSGFRADSEVFNFPASFPTYGKLHSPADYPSSLAGSGTSWRGSGGCQGTWVPEFVTLNTCFSL